MGNHDLPAGGAAADEPGSVRSDPQPALPLSADELLSQLDGDALGDAATMLSSRIEAWEESINTKRSLISVNVSVGPASALYLRKDGKRWRFAYIAGVTGEFKWLTECSVYEKARCAPRIPELVATLIECRNELFHDVMTALEALSCPGDTPPW